MRTPYFEAPPWLTHLFVGSHHLSDMVEGSKPKQLPKTRRTTPRPQELRHWRWVKNWYIRILG